VWPSMCQSKVYCKNGPYVSLVRRRLTLHVTCKPLKSPLMQSSDAVVGYSSVAVDVSLVVIASSCPIIITVSRGKTEKN
jgi:hypothetical protein